MHRKVFQFASCVDDRCPQRASFPEWQRNPEASAVRYQRVCVCVCQPTTKDTSITAWHTGEGGGPSGLASLLRPLVNVQFLL